MATRAQCAHDPNGRQMGFLRRKRAESLDPQYLLGQAEAATPPPATFGGPARTSDYC